MIIWMQKTGTIIGTGYDTTKRKLNERVTGNSPNDIINKVYDLYGCGLEWTLEMIFNSTRVCRGGFALETEYAPSIRFVGYGESRNHDHIGSRLSLYIK